METISGTWDIPQFPDLKFNGELVISDDGSAVLNLKTNEATRNDVTGLMELMQADVIIGPEENPINLKNPRVSTGNSGKGNEGNGGAGGNLEITVEGNVDLDEL